MIVYCSFPHSRLSINIIYNKSFFGKISPMETSIFSLLIGLIFFELFEVFWQQGSTIHAYLENLVRVYKKSVLLFIIFHPSFYYVIFCMMILNCNYIFASLIVGIKFIDICTKLVIVDRMSNNKPLGIYSTLLSTNQPFPWYMKLLPAVFYGMLFYGAFA